MKGQNTELKNVKYNCFPAGLLRAFNLHIMNPQEEIQRKEEMQGFPNLT